MNTKMSVLQGDITSLQVDAIVNAANSALLGGGGVDGAIHRAAGKSLVEECRLLGGCKVGQAKLTKGYNLPASFIIHTVGPVWRDGQCREPELLKNCYYNCLQLAVTQKLKTIAFPCISTGIYKYPKEKAAAIAVEVVNNFLLKSDILQEVIFCFFLEEDCLIYQRLLDG